MKKLKKRFIIPAVVFILGMCALIGAIYVVGKSQEQQNRTNAKLNAMTYTERIYGELMEGIGVTDSLKQVVISGDGNINRFYDIAANMMDDSIQSIQIAPNGVVTEIYPEERNESSKIDLINDNDRGEISRYARDNDTVIMQGPLKLKQGGYGIAVRNPVYLEDKNGQKSFWGFTIVILKVPEIFSESVEALSSFGYKYSLQKFASPWDDTYEWVYGSKEELNDPVIYDFDVYEDKWRLEILPKSGFYNNRYLLYLFIGGGVIVLLLAGLTAALISINENRKNFKRLAVTDALTGIYNRHGFDEQVEQYMRQNPQKHCVVAMLDIDDFKLVNDMYGHAAGDGALQKLAESMKQYFSKDVILGRNGGDEFSIFMPDCTVEEVKPFLKKFTGETKKFCSGIIIGNSCLEGVAFIEYRIYYMTPLGKRMQKKEIVYSITPLKGENGSRVNKVYWCVDKKSEFPGGDEALEAFFKKNLKNPQRRKISGIIKVIVEEDGTISSPCVIEGNMFGFDEEMIPIVLRMPKWTPAYIGDKAVRAFHDIVIDY